MQHIGLRSGDLPRAFWVVATVLALLTGCGGGSGDTGSSGSGTPLPATLDANVVARAETGTAVAFNTAIGSAAADLGFEWDFGDGDTSAAANPTHVYTIPGRYDWSVTVRNGAGEQVHGRGSLRVGWFDRLADSACSGADQGGWCWQQPTAAARALYDIDFLDDQFGVAVDSAGSVYVTGDGGLRWDGLPMPEPVALVRMTSAQNGWALASASLRLLRTRDGGRTWQPSGNRAPLTRVAAMLVRDAESVVLSGDQGDTVNVSVITTDAGGHWAPLGLYARHLSRAGAVWGTEAGVPLPPYGADDRVLPAPGQAVLPVPSCCGGERIVAASVRNDSQVDLISRTLYSAVYTRHRSLDGGRSWQAAPALWPPEVSGGAVLHVDLGDDGKGWAWAATQVSVQPGEDERTLLLRTVNGGRNWFVAGEWVAPAGSGQYPVSLDGDQLYVAGRIFTAADSGTGGTWRDARVPAETDAFGRPRRAGTRVLLVAYGPQPHEHWYASPDDGATWSALPGNAGPEDSLTSVNGLWFFDARQGLALRSDGVLLSSSDGGRSWQTSVALPQTSHSDGCNGLDAEGLHGAGDGALFAFCARQKNLYRSTDRGAHWQPVTTPDIGGVLQAQFVSASTGWLTLCAGLINRSSGRCFEQLVATTDGGRSWVPQGALPSETRMHWADAQLGVRVGIDGVIWRSADGGATWIQAQTDGSSGAPDVVLLSARGPSFIIPRYAGDALRSDDAGRTWHKVPGLRAKAMAFADARRGWAVGTGGQILRTLDGGLTWQAQDSGSDRDLVSLFVLDAQTLWVGGGRPPTVLSTSSGGD